MNIFIEKTDPDQSAVSGVVVNTEVTPGGQFPVSLTVTLNREPVEPIEAEDFRMEGEAANWLNPELHKFTAVFREISLDGKVLTLYFDGFHDKYFFVDHWKVINSKNPIFSFSSGKITRVIAPVADLFETFTEKEGEAFHYHLFTPKKTEFPLPIVVVFHGFGDTHNLLVYRTSLAWAEKRAQEIRPCYVLSPVIDEQTYFTGSGREKIYDAVMQKLKSMVEDGLVDANRIYIMGNSFGGMATIEFMERYPGTAAGAIALCSALNYSETAINRLDRITHIPLWIAAAENDHTIPSENSKNMAEKLTQLGAAEVHLTLYTDREMNAAGGSPDPDSTFSYHHVEMAVMEEESYAKWLFNQIKEKNI